MPINSRSLLKNSITYFSKEYGFSRREEQTFRLMTLDMVISSQDIAKKMKITDITARTHCKNMFKKCQVNNKAELIVVFLHFHTKILEEAYGFERP